jgi:uncharacterized protein YjhX (UPF0386 family)
LIRLFLISFLVFISTFSLKAGSFYPIKIEQLIQSSSQIVEGEVIDKNYLYDDGVIYTNYTLTINTTFKGNELIQILENHPYRFKGR